MRKESFLSSLFSSVILKAIGYISGFLKHIIIAAAIGLSGQLDVFYMAMTFIGILITTWAGALEFVAMPKLVKAESAADGERFGRIAGAILLAGTLASVTITVLAILFRDLLATLAFGFDIIQRERLADALLWLIPAMLLSFPLALFGSVLRAKRLFSFSFMSDALLAFVLLACIAFAPEHPAVLLWSMSLGVTLACIFAGIFAVRHIQFNASPLESEILDLLRLTPGLMLLFGTSAIFVALDRVFASFLPDGSISALAYAFILIQAAPHLLGIKESFITVAAEKASRRKRARSLNDLFSLVIFLSAGSMAFMVTVSEDVIAVLFERGAFGVTDTAKVVSALLAFLFMIPPIFVIPPIDQIYQIEKRVSMMVVRTLLGISVGIALNYIAVFVLDWGITGIAVATTISYWLIAMLGTLGLTWMGYKIEVFRHLKWAGWCGLFATTGCGLLSFLPDMNDLAKCLAAVAIIGTTMAVAGVLYPPSRETELLTLVRARLTPFRLR